MLTTPAADTFHPPLPTANVRFEISEDGALVIHCDNAKESNLVFNVVLDEHIGQQSELNEGAVFSKPERQNENSFKVTGDTDCCKAIIARFRQFTIQSEPDAPAPAQE